MAITIVRTPWIDDDGSGETGTVINNAEKQTIYNQIDQALAGLSPIGAANTFTGGWTQFTGNAGAPTSAAGIEIRGGSGVYPSAPGFMAYNRTGNAYLSMQFDAADYAWKVGGAGPGMTLTAPGVLAVNGCGTHTFNANGAGNNSLIVRNLSVSATSYASISVGNDMSANNGHIASFSSGWTAAQDSLPDGFRVSGYGTGGLSLSANHPSGAIRFYSGGSVERMQIMADGRVLWGTTTSRNPGRLQVLSDISFQWGVGISVVTDYPGGAFVGFTNAVGSAQGTITAVNSTTTAYNTTSDQRLKRDLGVAEDLTGLRAVVVHDFAWTDHDTVDRGIFAQEAQRVFPRAVTVGSEDLSRPWMTDYSKFVADLIVGWQQHDARLAALEGKDGSDAE